MKQTLTALAAAAVLAVASVAAPQPAQARCFGCAVGAGIIGGLAAGAIIGSAARPYYYGPGYYGYPGYAYAPGPVYYGPPPPPPSCYWTHSRYWNGYHWHWRRIRVCN
jgi:hypothetical protein